MTPQEQQMIDGLISRIRSTQVENKDTGAEQHIQSGLSGVPDALYVLVQTVLVQQYGLEQAQAQVDSLKQQVQTLQQAHTQEPAQGSGGSFLSHIFGGGSSSPAVPRTDASYQPVNYPPAQASYSAPPPPPYGQPAYPSSGGGMFGGVGMGGGGFLRGAVQTAAGVAAGEMMFRGMEDLFSGFGGGSERERGFTGAGGGGETIINNYGDDSGASRLGEGGGRDDSNFYNPTDDASRQNFGDSANFSGSSNDFSDNSNDFNNSNDDMSSSDDADSFDNSGNDDFSDDSNN